MQNDPTPTAPKPTPKPDDLLTGWQAELLLAVMFDRIAAAILRSAEAEAVLAIMQEITPLASLRWDCFTPTPSDGDNWRQWREATAKRDQQIAAMK